MTSHQNNEHSLYLLLIYFFHRPYWRCYYSNTDAIIYVVDSVDKDRIGISKQELVSMLEVTFTFNDNTLDLILTYGIFL